MDVIGAKATAMRKVDAEIEVGARHVGNRGS